MVDKDRSQNNPSGQNLQSSSRQDIDQFLEQVKTATPVATGGRGRLIFALDATASRQPTWDMATQLQSTMFRHTKGLGKLDVQLVFYRGYGECRNSRWVNNADALVTMMQKVSCMAGQTQIARVLKHALAESRSHPVNALVFVGDCMEENLDRLGSLAGELRLIGLPLFIFQEGHDPVAHRAFVQLASLSGGAHCRFDVNAAAQLGELLNAVAAYAAGGKEALKQLSSRSAGARNLLTQL